jgi:hypothetical protein
MSESQSDAWTCNEHLSDQCRLQSLQEQSLSSHTVPTNALGEKQLIILPAEN